MSVFVVRASSIQGSRLKIQDTSYKIPKHEDIKSTSNRQSREHANVVRQMVKILEVPMPRIGVPRIEDRRKASRSAGDLTTGVTTMMKMFRYQRKEDTCAGLV